jgi:hypothetical protein
LERVTARPDEYENGCCAEVCGVMQSIVALEGALLLCCACDCVVLSRSVARCGAAAALRDALRDASVDLQKTQRWRFSIQ